LSSSEPTYYWHDYETFGADPSRDRPVQFAGLRTDANLNPVGEPLVIYARPANDYLPHPEACLVTGITPQLALERGVPECEFIRRIHDELARPGTCGVGYNSIRFDDEVTRYTLYRNFYEPYAREWQNGNSRWDIIDMVRAAYALRPAGVEWPLREDGLPSFRLEDLTAANGISHGAAHDALSDVEATIGLARLIRDRQPKLYDYVSSHRDKKSALAMLDIESMRPVLHVSGMFGAKRHNIALVVPLAVNPENKNDIICYDLMADPSDMLSLSVEEVSKRLYTRSDELPEGVERPGLKSVHINKCPVLVTAKMADPETAARLGIDGERCRRHLAALRDARRTDPEAFRRRVQAISAGRKFPEISDPDRMRYAGFLPNGDKRLLEAVRDASPDELANDSFPFEDSRLPELLFRYRARNFPDSLNSHEREQWEAHRFQRLTEPASGEGIGMEEFQALIEHKLEAPDSTPEQAAILNALLEYGDSLLA